MQLVLVTTHRRPLSPTDRTVVDSQNSAGWKEPQSVSAQPAHKVGPTSPVQSSAQHELDFLCCVLFLQPAGEVTAK